MQSSPCVDSGMIYIGSGDNNLYAIDTSGNFKWKGTTKSIVRSSPCVYRGNVYVGSWDSFIYAFKKSDGSLVWKYNTQGSITSSPCISDSILYCGSRSYFFYAVNANTGKYYWKYVMNSCWIESSARFVNGLIYVGSSDFHYVSCFKNSDSLQLVWRCPATGDTWSSPFYDNGMLYIGTASYKSDLKTPAGGGLLAINTSTGKPSWTFDCENTPFIGGVASSPTVSSNIVYYGSIDSKVYAVENTLSAVDNKQGNPSLPKEYCIANYPNPFNPNTNISYSVPISGNISLKVYNVLGQEVATIFQGFKKAGAYIADFNASRLSSGVYIYRLQADKFSVAKSMILMK
jgi:outer membrane protein assembly factor BamB